MEETALLFDGKDAVTQLQLEADIQVGGVKAQTEHPTTTKDKVLITDGKQIASVEHYETVEQSVRH